MKHEIFLICTPWEEGCSKATSARIFRKFWDIEAFIKYKWNFDSFRTRNAFDWMLSCWVKSKNETINGSNFPFFHLNSFPYPLCLPKSIMMEWNVAENCQHFVLVSRALDKTIEFVPCHDASLSSWMIKFVSERYEGRWGFDGDETYFLYNVITGRWVKWNRTGRCGLRKGLENVTTITSMKQFDVRKQIKWESGRKEITYSCKTFLPCWNICEKLKYYYYREIST